MIFLKQIALLTLCIEFSVILYAAEYKTLEETVKAAEVFVGEKYNNPISKEVATNKILQIVNDATLSDNQKMEKLKRFISLTTEQETFSFYLREAEQGNAKAQCCLGWCYEKGEGVTKDPVEAVKWYRKSTEQARRGRNLVLVFVTLTAKELPKI